ncbi:MAG: hypothetical protein R2792_19370 [Saprospiraceae bacterium]
MAGFKTLAVGNRWEDTQPDLTRDDLFDLDPEALLLQITSPTQQHTVQLTDMKFNIILAILVVVMGYVTCRNSKDLIEGTAGSTPEYQYGAPPGVKASRVIHGSNPDSAVGVQIHEPPAYVDVKGAMQSLPPATASHRAYLSTGWWHLNMAYQPSDTTVHENYIRKWLHCEDQTFDVLQDNQVVDKGTWNWIT